MLVTLLINGLCLGCIYGMIGMGYSLVYKASGQVNFMQGDAVTLGGYIGFTLYKTLGIPFLPALIITMVVMFGFGILIQRGIISTVMKRSSQPVLIIFTTTALGMLLKAGFPIIWGAELKSYGYLRFNGNEFANIFGVNVAWSSIICLVISVVFMICLHLFMNKTKFGTAMRAAAMDSMAAKSCGINVDFTTAAVWGISCLVAAICGMLIGPLYGIMFMIGANLGGKGFSGSVTGGFGNMYGAIIGGVLVGIVETLIAAYISSVYKDLFTYVLLLVVLFVMPRGIMNEKAVDE